MTCTSPGDMLRACSRKANDSLLKNRDQTQVWLAAHITTGITVPPRMHTMLASPGTSAFAHPCPQPHLHLMHAAPPLALASLSSLPGRTCLGPPLRVFRRECVELVAHRLGLGRSAAGRLRGCEGRLGARGRG
eukprot:6203378-Pleurochrysis_carterae.AAC.1